MQWSFSAPSRARDWIRQHVTWPIAGFWLIALTPFFIENGQQLFSKLWLGKCDPHHTEAGQVYLSARTAARWVNPFLNDPDNVRLATFSVRDEGSFVMGNLCETREFTARLLRRIVAAQPAVIVIDWYNLPDRCEENDQRTKHLIDAVQDVVTGRVPIAAPAQGFFGKVPLIAARSTYRTSDLPEGEYIGRKDVLDKTSAQFATIRLDDCEEDRIPFKWKVRPAPDQPAHDLETLGLAAVRAANQSGAVRGLSSFIEHENRPYVSFLFPERAFPAVPAIDLLCDKRPEYPKDYRGCAEPPQDDPKLAALYKKIVILADVSTREDMHGTTIGELPGAILHANYIEAMINKAYLRPLNPWIQLIVSLIWFGAIEWIFVHYTATHRPLYALAVSLLVSGGFILIFFFIFVQFGGLNFVLLPPSLVLIFIRTCYALGEQRAAELKLTTHNAPVQTIAGGKTI